MRICVDQTIETKRERLYAMENEQHVVRDKWIKGEFHSSWLDPNGYIIEAYGEKWWIHVEGDKLSVRVVL